MATNNRATNATTSNASRRVHPGGRRRGQAGRLAAHRAIVWTAAVVYAFVLGKIAVGQTMSDDELFRQAAKQFHAGNSALDDPKKASLHFSKAVNHFDHLTQRGVNNAAHFRNQGNAELLADRLPRAILSYRRGLDVAPNDADLQRALQYARRQVDYTAYTAAKPPDVGWPAFLPYPNSRWLFMIAAFSYGGVWLGWVRWRVVGRRFWLLAAIVASVLCIVSSAGIWRVLHEQHYRAANPVVVVAHDASFFTGNSDKYPTNENLPELKRGMEARLIHQRGRWVQIQFANGAIGWTPRQSVLMDPP